MTVTNSAVAAVEFEFDAGVLCLDYINALEGWERLSAEERRGRFPSLVEWGRQARLIGGPEARQLVEAADPVESGRVVGRAVGLREAGYGVFSAAASGGTPDQEQLDDLNAFLGRSLRHLRLVRREDRIDWGWAPVSGPADRLLGPVAWSSAELLASDDRDRIRECAAETCRWLFLDRSRNRSRRWCDMKVCGNRAKAHRHYHRERGPS